MNCTIDKYTYIDNQLNIIAEYLQLVSVFSSRDGAEPGYVHALVCCAKGHFFKLGFRMFNTAVFSDIRSRLANANHVEAIHQIYLEMKQRAELGKNTGDSLSMLGTSWYGRHSMINTAAISQ